MVHWAHVAVHLDACVTCQPVSVVHWAHVAVHLLQYTCTGIIADRSLLTVTSFSMWCHVALLLFSKLFWDVLVAVGLNEDGR
jgi:hypothetical protein